MRYVWRVARLSFARLHAEHLRAASDGEILTVRGRSAISGRILGGNTSEGCYLCYQCGPLGMGTCGTMPGSGDPRWPQGYGEETFRWHAAHRTVEQRLHDIECKVDQLLAMEEQMAAEQSSEAQALDAAISALNTELEDTATVDQAIEQELVGLQEALGKVGPTTPEQVNAVTAATEKLTALTSKLKGSEPAPPAEEPPVEQPPVEEPAPPVEETVPPPTEEPASEGQAPTG